MVEPTEGAGPSETVFVSYAHADSTYFKDLRTHLLGLHNMGLVDEWSDQRIAAGDLWREEIDAALNNATVAVLLITPEFLSSDFITAVELPMLLERARSGGLRILQVIVESSVWELAPQLKHFQTINHSSKPLAEQPAADQQRVWVETALACVGAGHAANGGRRILAQSFDPEFVEPSPQLPQLSATLPASRLGRMADMAELLLTAFHLAHSATSRSVFASGLRALQSLAAADGVYFEASLNDDVLQERVGEVERPEIPAWLMARSPDQTAGGTSSLLLQSNHRQWLVVASNDHRRGSWLVALQGIEETSFFATDLGAATIHAFVEGLRNPAQALLQSDAEAVAVRTLDVLRRQFHALPSSLVRERRRLLEMQLEAVRFDFQPVLRLDSTPTFHSYEALARDIATGAAPLELFSSTELWQLTADLDVRLLEICLSDYEQALVAANIKRSGDERPVAFNVYGPTLLEEEFWARANHLLRTRFSRVQSKVMFEFSEKMPMDAGIDDLLLAIQSVQGDLRPPISIDDFGAGYSSIALLSELRPDFVKIDSSILHAPKKEGALCIDYVVAMTRLNATAPRVVVEGFDTACEWTAQELYQAGIRYVQGFSVAEPKHELSRIEQNVVNRHACPLPVAQ